MWFQPGKVLLSEKGRTFYVTSPQMMAVEWNNAITRPISKLLSIASMKPYAEQRTDLKKVKTVPVTKPTEKTKKTYLSLTLHLNRLTTLVDGARFGLARGSPPAGPAAGRRGTPAAPGLSLPPETSPSAAARPSWRWRRRAARRSES